VRRVSGVDLEVVDRLQEIRFALTCLPTMTALIRRQIKVYALEIPEIPNRDVVDADARLCSCFRRSGGGCSAAAQ
jgi:hypothetical protein